MTINKKFQSHLMAAPTKPRPMMDDAPDFNVSHDDENVVLGLGVMPEFKLPKATSIKLALLILRHCGVEVDHG